MGMKQETDPTTVGDVVAFFRKNRKRGLMDSYDCEVFASRFILDRKMCQHAALTLCFLTQLQQFGRLAGSVTDLDVILYTGNPNS